MQADEVANAVLVESETVVVVVTAMESVSGLLF